MNISDTELLRIVLGTDDHEPPYRALPPPRREVIYAMAMELLQFRRIAKKEADLRAAILADEQKLYDTVKEQSLAAGMEEVEPGHFVRPGEPWTGEDGVFHPNV